MKLHKILLFLGAFIATHVQAMDTPHALSESRTKMVTTYHHKKGKLYEHTLKARVGSQKGEVASSIIFDIDNKAGIIRSFETEEKFRNSKDKIGTFLFQECIDFLMKKNCTKITWFAMPFEKGLSLETLITIYEKIIRKLNVITHCEIKREKDKAHFSLWILKPTLFDSATYQSDPHLALEYSNQEFNLHKVNIFIEKDSKKGPSLGYLTFTENEERMKAYLGTFFVSKEYRTKKLGSLLFNRTIEWLVESGFTTLYWDAIPIGTENVTTQELVTIYTRLVAKLPFDAQQKELTIRPSPDAASMILKIKK